MDLTNINKLYTPDGRELVKLYDNLGRLIWQVGPPVLWQGSWAWSGNIVIKADWNKYKSLMFEFDKAISNPGSSSGFDDIKNGNQVYVSLARAQSKDYRLLLYVIGASGSRMDFLFGSPDGMSLTIYPNGNQSNLTLKAIYGIEKQ